MNTGRSAEKYGDINYKIGVVQTYTTGVIRGFKLKFEEMAY